MRFPEFDGEWEQVNLGECSISLDYGMNAAAKSYDGINKYIRITDIDEYSSRYKSENPVSPSGNIDEKYLVGENEILFARTGASTGKSYLYHNDDGKIYFAGFLIRAKIKNQYNSKFIFSQTQTEKYNKWVQLMSMRSGQPGINSQEYSSFKFFMSSTKAEQDKIASLLSLIDKRIYTQNKIIENLKTQMLGLQEKIFRQKIKFKDSKRKDFPLWISKKGDELFESVSNKNHNSDLPILAITQDKGAIPRDLIDYQITVTERSIESYKVVEIGDFIISLRSFQGGIEHSDYKGICSPAYIILRNKIEIAQNFYKYYLKNPDYIKLLNRKLEGIRDGKMISFGYFAEIELPFPIIEEQKRIASFLRKFDLKIQTEKDILEQLNKQKQHLLQQMFV